MSDSRTYSIKQLTKIKLKVARQNKIIQFMMSAFVALLLTYVLRDPSFAITQDYVMFLLFFAIGLWITEAIPPFAVGILIIGFIVFTMGRESTIDVQQYVQTWSDGVIWLFLGGFFLAEGMKKTKLDVVLMKFAPEIPHIHHHFVDLRKLHPGGKCHNAEFDPTRPAHKAVNAGRTGGSLSIPG